jgi:hypothetical protein
MTDFLMEQLKSEQNNLRIYQVISLLRPTSGILLIPDIPFKALPQFRDQVVEDWASGKFHNATELLKASWTYDDDAARIGTVYPQRLDPILRYGVFALPFIIEELQQRNSPELFAAFLNVSGELDLYALYIEKPNDLLSSRTDKLWFVKAWADENANKLDKLGNLNSRIRALTAQ